MSDQTFGGWDLPESNWSKLPHQMVDMMADVSTLAEMKVTIYILRHTWGYQEFDTPKRITMDEFQHGRKKSDGTRIDNGCGMAYNSIKSGIDSAIERGTVYKVTDDSDAARVENSYGLSGCQNLQVRPSISETRPSKVDSRTEKDTSKKDTSRKKTTHAAAQPPADPDFGKKQQELAKAYYDAHKLWHPDNKMEFKPILGQMKKHVDKVTPQEISDTYLSMKEDEFWRHKLIKIPTVIKNIGIIQVVVESKRRGPPRPTTKQPADPKKEKSAAMLDLEKYTRKLHEKLERTNRQGT